MIFIGRSPCQVGTFSLVSPVIASAFAPDFQSRRSAFSKMGTLMEERDVMKLRKASKILEEIAGDYLHLAQDADGKVDATRRRRYRWLINLVRRMRRSA